jgi:SAM-dependent methyltransferase
VGRVEYSDVHRTMFDPLGRRRLGETKRCVGSVPQMTTVTGQARHWSRHARQYDDVFLNPFVATVQSPLMEAIDAIPASSRRSIIDLGCGTGPLLPGLMQRFRRVVALDFAPAMVEKSRERLGDDVDRVEFLLRPMHDLADLAGQFNAAVAVNSLVMPDVREIHETLVAIHECLKPEGWFIGVLPSIDAIQYQSMLLVDRALSRGMEPKEAEKLAAQQAEHTLYDFAFGRFAYHGLRQKFWQAFEIEFRLKKAGFSDVRISKLLYPWDDNLPCGSDFVEHPRSWDWTFVARR